MIRARRTRGFFTAIAAGSVIVACAATSAETDGLLRERDAGVLDDASRDVTVSRAEASIPQQPAVEDTGSPAIDTGPAPECPSSCTYDAECQAACPGPPSGGQNCCDVGSNACYVSASGDCTMGGGGDPDGGADGGTD